MSGTHVRVIAAEIGELVRSATRLSERGEHATCAEWIAYYETSADLFDRIADDPWTVDPTDAKAAANRARDKANRLRAEAGEWGWW